MGIEIIFLGTSAGVPTKRRNVSSIALRPRESREWLLFDCGEATQHRILHTPISTAKISKIFITHLHGDHIYGIFGLLASRAMSGVTTPISIYAPSGIDEMIECVKRFSGLNLNYEIDYHILRGGERLEFGEYRIETIKLSHSIESIGYIFIERDREGHFDIEKAIKRGIKPSPIIAKLKRGESIKLNNGEIIDGKEFIMPSQRGVRVIISGDNDNPNLYQKYKDIDVMIHEATYLQKDFEKLKKRFQHTTVESLAVSAQNMGVKRLVMTHISPRYDSKEAENRLIEVAKAHFTGEVVLAQDLMKIEI